MGRSELGPGRGVWLSEWGATENSCRSDNGQAAVVRDLAREGRSGRCSEETHLVPMSGVWITWSRQ